jgi:hypothetical protein
MNWKSLGGKVAETGAHLLGTALAGPGAGAALGSIVGTALGVSDPTPDNIAAAMDKDPEAAVKLATIQSKRQTDLEQIAAQRAVQLASEETKRIQSDAADRASARDLQHLTELPQMALSCAFIFGYFLAIFAMMTGYVHIPADLNAPFVTVLGVLTASVMSIMNFWFGSSKNSQDKDGALQRAQDRKP